jgi:hypothetical protein
VSNSLYCSYLCFLSAGIIGVYHHTQLCLDNFCSSLTIITSRILLWPCSSLSWSRHCPFFNLSFSLDFHHCTYCTEYSSLRFFSLHFFRYFLHEIVNSLRTDAILFIISSVGCTFWLLELPEDAEDMAQMTEYFPNKHELLSSSSSIKKKFPED